MHTSSLWAKVLILAMTCLLTASCADFFKDSKSNNQNPTNPTDPNKPTTGGDNDPSKPSDPSLPEEFKNVNEGAFSEQKMLINIGANVMTPAVNDFAIKTPALKKSIATLCQSLSEGSSAKIETLQAQLDWEKAMMAFHEVQAAPLGPLMDRGRFLNDYLYSWPYLNTCAVDKKVYENSERPQAGNALMFNERGLFAIEYLIFEKSLRSNCNLRAHPQMKIWNERSVAQKKLDRCLWAKELMKDIDDKSQELKSLWAFNQGNFTKQLIDGSRYSSTKEAINALTDAMANIEFLKDIKLGKPTARHKDCSSDKCPNDVEHIYSGTSLQAAEAHMKAFKAIVTGSSSNQQAFGLDDLLIQSGRTDVAQKLIAAIDSSIATIQRAQENGTLKEQIEGVDPVLCKGTSLSDRKAEICAVHAEVREVAFLLKTEVLAALALRAPPTNQGDND